MAGINWGSIMKKAEAYMETPAAKKKTQKIIDEYAFGVRTGGKGGHSVKEAGDRFADVLYDAIHTSGLDREVLDDNMGIMVSDPKKLRDGTYMVIVTLPSKMRDTMSSLKSYYPVDLVELYNDGVDHVMRQIWETDATGRKTTSRTVIPGSHYMEQAIINFMGNYAYEYNVISVERI